MLHLLRGLLLPKTLPLSCAAFSRSFGCMLLSLAAVAAKFRALWGQEFIAYTPIIDPTVVGPINDRRRTEPAEGGGCCS